MASTLKTTWIKVVAVVGGGVVLAVSAYAALRYYRKWKSRLNDEGFEDTSRIEEHPEKRILILGLDGCGKSSFVANLSRIHDDQQKTKPTEGFHVMCVHTNDAAINIWEIGGAETYRKYWYNFLQDTDVLVFVVDSTDTKRLSQCYDELHKLLADERLKNVPLLILANKQDLPNALSPDEVGEALNLKSLSPKYHKTKVLGTQISGKRPTHSSIQEAEDTMIRLACGH